MQFNLTHWDYAKVSEQYRFHDQGIWPEWSLKGFGHGWIIANGNWKSDMKVLEVGGGMSPLPAFLADNYGVEAWVADDFGTITGQSIYAENYNLHDAQQKYSQVKYVPEPIGYPGSTSLPEDYFDRIYTVSTLEHIPIKMMNKAFEHMVRLLKPGGRLMHCIDIPFPLGPGKNILLKIKNPSRLNNLNDNFINSMLIKMISNVSQKPNSQVFNFIGGLASIPIQLIWHYFSLYMAKPGDPYLESAAGWWKFLHQNLNITSGFNLARATNLFNMTLDPDIVVETIQEVYERRYPRKTSKPYWRVGGLVFVLDSYPVPE